MSELAEAIAVRVAGRVAELLRQDAAPIASLTAAQVAQRYGVTRGWVYEHAAELGAIRLGDGTRPRLRFDAATVAQRLAARGGSERPKHQASPGRPLKPGARRRRAAGGSVELLPIHTR